MELSSAVLISFAGGALFMFLLLMVAAQSPGKLQDKLRETQAQHLKSQERRMHNLEDAVSKNDEHSRLIYDLTRRVEHQAMETGWLQEKSREQAEDLFKIRNEVGSHQHDRTA